MRRFLFGAIFIFTICVSALSAPELILRRAGYELWKLPSSEPALFPEVESFWLHLYLPRSGTPAPAALVLPILGAGNLWLEERLARALQRRGVLAAILELPYQHHRVPYPAVGSGELFARLDPPAVARNFQQALADISSALDFLSAREEVRKDRFGIAGISLGAIVAAAALGTEKRLSAAALLLGGWEPADLFWDGAETRGTAKRWERAGWTREKTRAAWAEVLPEGRSEARVALWNASFDRVIPRANRRTLARRLSPEKVHSVPAGHYSSILFWPWVSRSAAEFLARRLK